MSEESRPFIGVGQLFEVGNEHHVVTSFEGFLIDGYGKKHPISNCRALIWTGEELLEAKIRAEALLEVFQSGKDV
jgi:hypothetical protein